MRAIPRLRALLVIIWATLLTLLAPTFFFNYGGGWLLWVAERWPLDYPP